MPHVAFNRAFVDEAANRSVACRMLISAVHSDLNKATQVISYCVAVFRPVYSRLLLSELIEKTTVPFEILIWLNVSDPAIEDQIACVSSRGVKVRVVGRTPENIGMRAYLYLFCNAQYEMITQIDDDVVCLSHGIAERAHRLFRRFPCVRQIVSDVWQDEHTTGARPPLGKYTIFDDREGLYLGPIDGWFSIYHRSILPILMSLPYHQYLPIGCLVRAGLARRSQYGVLDSGMRVFHVVGPAYTDAFGMLDFEIQKYRRLGRVDLVDWYEGYRAEPLPREELAWRVDDIRASLGGTHAV
jgi:hypothetical protein